MEIEETENPASHTKSHSLLGFRHVQALLLFFAFMLCFAMTVNMSIAIVVMTDTTQTNAFDWSIRVQSVILSSFFWGYLILQIAAGELANRFGGKILTVICVGINALASLALPMCAYYGGWQMVCACRVIQGLFQGFLMPSAHNLLAKWAPLHEKTRIGVFVYVGAQLGTALQLLIGGIIADYCGWPYIFYSNGILGVIWTIVYLALGSNSPEESKIISEREKKYIQTSLGHVGGHQKLKTPWRSIATSLPFLSVVVAHCGFKWGFYTLLTEIPTYMHKVFGVNIKTNGMLSALPYLATFLLSFPFSFMSDIIINRKWLRITTSRKCFNTIGYFGPAAILIALAHVPAGNVTLAIILLTLAVGINAAFYSGYMLGSLDMAPNFAGTLIGLSNTIADLIAIFAPLVIGVMLTEEVSFKS
ncbi:unnamed protein product [Parnassius apollo]|uniref:Putative inorganic phosphate cotransporter n=1 Tax=Parnassius apollo TaxID=110799 RepID=A0A8S3XUU2_PARAO|nr:unnamed protein product [Parnassius apollo]